MPFTQNFGGYDFPFCEGEENPEKSGFTRLCVAVLISMNVIDARWLRIEAMSLKSTLTSCGTAMASKLDFLMMMPVSARAARILASLRPVGPRDIPGGFRQNKNFTSSSVLISETGCVLMSLLNQFREIEQVHSLAMRGSKSSTGHADAPSALRPNTGDSGSHWRRVV